MGLFGFGKKAEKAQIPSTFAGRVDKFWAEFSGVIDEIKADLAAEEFEKAMRKTDEKLRICLAEPYFMTGLAGDKLDLVLTPEGMRHRLFWLSFIKNAMPKQLEGKMLCTLGKPRGSEVREDVVVGTTCLRNLIGEYLGGKRDIYNEAFELGIKFCFLSIGNGGDMQAGFDLRNKIEDEELEGCGSFLEIIGGATGQKHAYIDLICYNEEKLKEKVQQLCKKYDANIQIHDFKR